MLSRTELLDLREHLADRPVLSLYLDAEQSDPAERRAWRIRLNHLLKDLEDELAARSSSELEAARAAIKLVNDRFAGTEGLLPERGWVAFASPDQLWYAGPSAAPMPDLIRWERGMHVAPYVRALKQSRPVMTLLVDQRRARLLRYQHGEISHVAEFQSQFELLEASDGASKRSVRSSGVRGQPRSDSIRRAEEVATLRMVREAVAALAESSNQDRLTAVGGSLEPVARVLALLPDRIRHRTIELGGLHIDATHSEIEAALDAAASTLSVRLQKDLVDEVIDLTRADGRACLGLERTNRALESGAVETLVLSRAFALSQPDVADTFVGAAFDRGATVEEVGGVAAVELDGEGGVGARLRFAV